MAAIASVAKFLSPRRGLGGWLGQPVQEAIQAAERGRLIKTLSELSDEQLGELGIARHDISAHAARLARAAK